MKPTDKNKTLVAFLDAVAGRTTHIENETCVMCHKAIGPFRDDLSRTEYTISGICQTCQDVVFAEPPEDPYIDGRDDDWREW